MKLTKLDILNLWEEILKKRDPEDEEPLHYISILKENIDGNNMTKEKGRTLTFPIPGNGETGTYSQFGNRATKLIRNHVELVETDGYSNDKIEEVYELICSQNPRRDYKKLFKKLDKKQQKDFFYHKRMIYKLYRFRNEVPISFFTEDNTRLSYETLAYYHLNYFNKHIRPLL